MLSNEELVKLSKQGLIHGPDESFESFFLRCREAFRQDCCLKSDLAKQIFDVDPDWVKVCYKNRRLHFWEAACTWVDSNAIMVQLRKVLETNKSYWGYFREEVLAHETVHAVRCGFDEDVFEEVIAYQTSSSRLRRLFGPLFRSAKECHYTLLCLLGGLVAGHLWDKLFLSGLVFLLLGAGGFGRLFRVHYLFARTRRVLSKLVDKESVLAIILRLTDREIIRFAKMNPEELMAYVIKMSRTQLRWKQIRFSYFS